MHFSDLSGSETWTKRDKHSWHPAPVCRGPWEPALTGSSLFPLCSLSASGCCRCGPPGPVYVLIVGGALSPPVLQRSSPAAHSLCSSALWSHRFVSVASERGLWACEVAARPLRTPISPHNIHSPVCVQRLRDSASVFDRKWQRVCMCEQGQADNSEAKRGEQQISCSCCLGKPCLVKWARRRLGMVEGWGGGGGVVSRQTWGFTTFLCMCTCVWRFWKVRGYYVIVEHLWQEVRTPSNTQERAFTFPSHDAELPVSRELL